jgi:CxxC-x17-CxxC domain-containing protein
VDPAPGGAIQENTLAFADKQITCRDCGNNFVFTGGEQEFYASKGLMNEPSRCPTCRSARRQSQNSMEAADGYVRYGNFASFGGKTPRQMHPATCAECSQMTEVPFVPRGERPVYCSNCYNKIKPPAPRTDMVREVERPRAPRPVR